MSVTLVTGGAGFIGSNLVKYLLKQGLKVRVFDNFSRGSDNRLQSIKDEIEIIDGDICNINNFSKAFHDVDTIYHLAAINGTRHFYEMPERVLEVNTKGIINALDLSISNNVEKFIFSSSSEVYNQPDRIPTPETERILIPDVTNPRFSYSGSKVIGELFCINYAKKYNIDTRIIRYHNIYGPDMGFEHVIPDFIIRMETLSKNIHNNKIDFPIQGSGKETRAFCYIDDAVEGTYLISKKGLNGQIYNIGNDQEEISINDLAFSISKNIGLEINIIQGSLRVGSTIRRCPDISKIKKIGYEPKVSLNKGIEYCKKWYWNRKDSF